MNTIYENINARYDSHQMAIEKAFQYCRQEQELCMLFDQVNASAARKHQPEKEVHRDFSAAFGILFGMASMALFLTAGMLLGI